MPGISAVIRIPAQEKKILDEKIGKMELLGAIEMGKVKMESSVYRSLSDQVKYRSFQVFTMSDFPATCFVVNDAEPDKMLTCDLAFREFPGLLKGVYEYEKKLQVDGNGVKYRLGDFYINFMTLSLGQSPTIKGLLLELAFQPTCPPSLSGELLRAFGRQHFPELFTGQVMPVFTATLKKAFADNSSQDALPKPSTERLLTGEAMDSLSRATARATVAQYIEHLRELRSHS
ncbi:Mediator of RNA polymerase II transcription subunit 20 [Echinococcus granulosus]|nr:Mediator of RNA polymerase II transcription subunit 20 [Echinococcus granulosus]